MSLPRIVFAGTPQFAVPTLSALVGAGLPVVGVFTQPDRKVGRGKKLQAPPVKRYAEEHGLPVFQPPRIRDDLPTLQGLSPDFLVVVAYGQLLTQAVLDVPSRDTLNVHASLLPRWRGAAPIQRAIEAGDERTGVAIMRVVLELDAGPVYRLGEIPIEAADTTASLHDRLATLGAELLVETVRALISPAPPQAREQDASQVTYAHKLSKAQAVVNWHDSALVIERRVRAFNPWPVCQTGLSGLEGPVRIWAAKALANPAQGVPELAPGTVCAQGPEGVDVVTGDGLLRITTLQAPGRKAISAKEFVNSIPLLDRQLQ